MRFPLLTIKRNFAYILFFSLLCIIIQSSYSYVADLFDGKVKYGTYHCVKDGTTCDFERYEGGSEMSGDACPSLDRNMKFEEYNKIRADFFSSKYCSFTPTKVKKYNCRYDVGSATVFVKEGKVISVSSSLSRKNIQEYYEPNNCVESKMEGDNGEPPLIKNYNDNESKYNPFDPNHKSNISVKEKEPQQTPDIAKEKNNVEKHIEKKEVEQSIEKDMVEISLEKAPMEQPIKKEIEPFDEKITSLQNEVEALKSEINILKEQNTEQKQYSGYQFIFLVIAFVLSLIALFKSKNNPYNKL